MKVWSFMKYCGKLMRTYGVFIEIRCGKWDCVDIIVHAGFESSELKWNVMKEDSCDVLARVEAECRKIWSCSCGEEERKE